MTSLAGGVCSRRGHCPCGMRPPFSFWSCPKRECAAPGGREKGACALRCSGPPRDGGRRIGACSDSGLPSGTLGSSAIPVTAVPWRMVRRLVGVVDGFDLLLFPRVPLRYALPGPSRKRERQRKEELGVSLTSPGQRIPQGLGVSVPDCREGVPTIPRRGVFSLGPCNRAAVGGSAALRMRHTPCGYGPFSFCRRAKREWGVEWTSHSYG